MFIRLAACLVLFTHLASAALSQDRVGVFVHAQERQGRKSLPVSGVDVVLYALNEPEQSLGRGTTDEDGQVEFHVPLDRVRKGRANRTNLRARIVEPGLQRTIAHAAFHGESITAESRLSIVLDLTEGGTLDVHMVDPDGKPVKALVKAFKPNQEGDRLYPYSGPALQSVGRGRVAVHFRRDADVTLFADGGKLGTGGQEGVELRVSGERAVLHPRGAGWPEELPMLVSGRGVVRCRLLGRDGLPSIGAAVVATLEAAELSVKEDAWSDGRRELESYRGGGRLQSIAQADDAGWVQLEGLREGQVYVLRHAELQPSAGPVQHGAAWIGRVEASVVPEAQSFTVDRSTLVVQLLDPSGKPVPAAPPSRWLGEPGDSWSEGARVAVYDLDSFEGEGSPRAVVDEMTPAVLAVNLGVLPAVFEVEPGRRYVVAALGGDFYPEPRFLDVRDRGAQVSLSFQAPPSGRREGLSINVVASPPSVASENPFGSGLDARVRVEDVATRLPLIDRCDSNRWPLELQLPQGAYRLVVDGQASIDGHHGTVFHGRTRGRAAETVNVVSGGVAVELELGRAAYAALRLEGGTRAQGGAQEAGLAQVELHSSEGWRTGLSHVGNLPGMPLPYGPHLHAHWPLGSRITSDGVPEGDYWLVARMPGGRAVSKQVSLRAGKTVDVSLSLDR